MSLLVNPEALPRCEAESAVSSSATVIVDCRFQLSDPEAGRREYDAGHVPGAVFADLERDLSGPITVGVTGRHPLPSPEALAGKLRTWGVCSTSRVIAYDAAQGALAARLWWLLRWLGHDSVAVVDGGYPAWLAAGGEPSRRVPAKGPGDFVARVRSELVVSVDDVLRASNRPNGVLLDARAPERFRGEVEPIDPVPGHIPGAVCASFAANLSDGRFLSVEALRDRYRRLIGDRNAEDVIVYCGSGVTACHDILAAELAGLGMFRLYAGSYSEWLVDPTRPVATGA